MRCPNCGSEVPKGKNFCGHCGRRLAQVDAGAPAGFDDSAPTAFAGPSPSQGAPQTPEGFDDEAATQFLSSGAAGTGTGTWPREEHVPRSQPLWPEDERVGEPGAQPLAGKNVRDVAVGTTARAWHFAWLATLGWCAVFGVQGAVKVGFFDAVRQQDVSLEAFAVYGIGWALLGLVGGTLTGVGLRGALAGAKDWHAVAVALGWAASMGLSSPMGRYAEPAGWFFAVFGAVLGLAAALVSSWGRAAPWWRHALRVVGFGLGTAAVWHLANLTVTGSLFYISRSSRVYQYFRALDPGILGVGWGTGALLTVLVWQRAEPSMGGQQAFISVLGWIGGLVLGVVLVLGSAVSVFPAARYGLMGGLLPPLAAGVGSGVLVWQTLGPRRGGA